jgi:hypothetical protein
MWKSRTFPVSVGEVHLSGPASDARESGLQQANSFLDPRTAVTSSFVCVLAVAELAISKVRSAPLGQQDRMENNLFQFNNISLSWAVALDYGFRLKSSPPASNAKIKTHGRAHL